MKSKGINRRDFLKGTACAVTTVSLAGHAVAAGPGKIKDNPAQTFLPRWRGFNLLNFFQKWSDKTPREDDFKWMRDWGFDFIRLPMSYKLWIEGGDVYKIKESTLEQVDKVVEWGDKYGIHTSLNFHRGPGYCVNNDDTEPFDLWKDKEALDAFCFHWELFAKRYKGIDSKKVSFDLINEPKAPGGAMSRKDYEKVVRETVKTIRAVDPKRYIIIDGLSWGRDPVEEVMDLKLGQSCRGYDPMEISHYKASWVRGERFPEPVWPDTEGKAHKWDRARLERHYQPWIDIAKKGAGVHCGECGCYNRTPHDVFLRWFRDVLEILTANNIGYSVWNLRGSFGVVDSGRSDVDYEDFGGHKLDRKFLKLLQEF